MQGNANSNNVPAATQFYLPMAATEVHASNHQLNFKHPHTAQNNSAGHFTGQPNYSAPKEYAAEPFYDQYYDPTYS